MGGPAADLGRSECWRVLTRNDPRNLTCNLRFCGQYEDEESGLFYNRHRYYERETGQYLSPDPLNLSGGFNPYGYVHDPVNWIDPFGLAGCDPQINAEHVFHGEINRRGRAVGFHHEASIGHQGKARITEITNPPNAHGVYQGKVEVLDARTNQWVAKGPDSTFFPQSWNRQQVMSEIRGAYKNGTVQPNGKWSGTSPSGVKIEGWLDSSGNINTAFPKYID